MTDYENEHAGIWGTENASWTCYDCGAKLLSPADFEIVEGENVCRECLSDSTEKTEQSDP